MNKHLITVTRCQIDFDLTKDNEYLRFYKIREAIIKFNRESLRHKASGKFLELSFARNYMTGFITIKHTY
jgi:hypothetical protein